MICGHRPPAIGGYKTPNPTEQWVRFTLRGALERLREKLARKGNELTAICGMAIGTDMIGADECRRLGIPYIAAVPFEGQEKRWPERTQTRYRGLVKEAADVVVVDTLEKYAVDNVKAKFILRNRWMLDNSEMVIAVWDGSGGGTSDAVREAKKRSLLMMVLDPRRRAIYTVCGEETSNVDPTG
jgi:uncharacterized phage-like protein YoqJ